MLLTAATIDDLKLVILSKHIASTMTVSGKYQRTMRVSPQVVASPPQLLCGFVIALQIFHLGFHLHGKKQ